MKIENNRIYLDEVDSTNNYLKKYGNTLPDQTVVIAKHQTAGRGRQGKCWQDKEGESLLASWLFHNLTVAQMELLPLAAGLSVCQVLEGLGFKPTFLKWPNDVVAILDGEFLKLAGILCESRIGKDTSFAVCGMGLNISQTRQDLLERNLPFACSINSIWGKEIALKLLIDKIGQCFFHNIQLLVKSNKEILTEYQKICITLGRKVKIESVQGCYLAKALSVTEKGELICQTEKGEEIKVRSGEVSVRGLYGYI